MRLSALLQSVCVFFCHFTGKTGLMFLFILHLKCLEKKVLMWTVA